MTPDLVVLGNLVVDDVVRDDGTTRMAQPGGAALYAALGARLWGIAVGIVTRVGRDYPERVLDELAARGIDLAGARPMDGPGLRSWLLYEGGLRRVVHRLGGPTHAAASPDPDDLPTGWDGRACHLAPMPFDVQARLVEALGRRRGVHLSLDPYELLTAERLADWRRLLAGVELFLLSEDEMEVPGGREEPGAVLADLAGGRLSLVLYKQGARGGLVVDVGRRRTSAWAPRAAAVADPTGAGDAFAGGMLAGHLLGEPLPQALERGVVAASFALEGQGAEGLLAAGPAQAEARRREWYGR